MRYRISKAFAFSASHVLTGLPAGHPCGCMHGHNYQAELVLESDRLDQHGFVVDYRDQVCAVRISETPQTWATYQE